MLNIKHLSLHGHVIQVTLIDWYTKKIVSTAFMANES